MHEIITATGQGQKITRLTLFPPSGKPESFVVKQYDRDASGVLKFTDSDGITYETTLPYTIEQIREGHQKTPFK